MSDAPQPAAPDTAAAELALGVAEGDERAQALRRRVAEPAFAREVDSWNIRLAMLAAAGDPVEPPARLFDRIERSLDARPASPSSLRIWRVAAIVSALAACLLLAVLTVRHWSRPTEAPVMIAELAPAAQGPGATALYDPAAGSLRIPRFEGAGRGRTAQLWAIGGDGVPRSLGLLGASGATRLDLREVPGSAGLRPGVTLAISIEREGGSRTGKPEGPVVAKGTLEPI